MRVCVLVSCLFALFRIKSRSLKPQEAWTSCPWCCRGPGGGGSALFSLSVCVSVCVHVCVLCGYTLSTCLCCSVSIKCMGASSSRVHHKFITSCHEFITSCHEFITSCHEFITSCHEFITSCHEFITSCHEFIMSCHEFITSCHEFITSCLDSSSLFRIDHSSILLPHLVMIRPGFQNRGAGNLCLHFLIGRATSSLWPV